MIAFVFRLENTDIQTRIKGIPVKWMKENYRIMSYGKITDKQREILEYIKAEILNRGYPPAVREICEAVKLKSTSSVHAHLETLEKNGYIRRDPTKPRAIEIVDEKQIFSHESENLVFVIVPYFHNL